MFKIVNGLMPNYLLNCLSIKAKSKHNLRCHQDFSLVFTTKTIFKRSFVYHGPYLWNHLPANVKNTECLCVFKNMCKKYILD